MGSLLWEYARSENGASVTALVHDDASDTVLFRVAASQLTDTHSRHGRNSARMLGRL